MTSEAWARGVYRECSAVIKAFLMGQRSAEEWLVSVHICNLYLAFCSFRLVLSGLMHSFLSFNLDAF